MLQAVANGQVDVISAFSTDGRIAALDLVLLEDERQAIPPSRRRHPCQRETRPRASRRDRGAQEPDRID